MRLIPLATALLAALTATASAAPNIANRTQLSYEPVHGTQVEYIAVDGSSWLWYPANAVILRGAWRFEEADICFLYGADGDRPVTRNTEGNWDCVPYEVYHATVIESRKGDIFALQRRADAPFKLSRSRLSLDQLQNIAGMKLGTK